jgi:stage II sporulation protein AA (anti-sigma F factor antagonist)
VRDRLVDVGFEMRDGDAVAALSGEVDSSNSRELRAALLDRLPPEAGCLVLNLAAVRYLDSSGIEFLFDLGGRLATRRQALRLAVPEDAPVRRVLELCDISSAMTVDPTVDDALARGAEE